MKLNIKKINSAKFYHVDPRNLLDDINSLPELWYLANLATPVSSKSKLIPELALIIGQDAYAKLINFFGGQNVYIPTKEELQNNLLGLMSYYYHNIKGLSWGETMKKLSITLTKGNRRLVRNRWKIFKDLIENTDNKIPEFEHQQHPDIKQADAPVKCDDIYIPKAVFIKAANKLLLDIKESAPSGPDIVIFDDDFIKKALEFYE